MTTNRRLLACQSGSFGFIIWRYWLSSWLLAAMVVFSAPAAAHSTKPAYLDLSASVDGWGGYWLLPLSEFAAASTQPLDQDRDGVLDWGELLDGYDAVQARLLPMLRVTGNTSSQCNWVPTRASSAAQLTERQGQTYVVIPLQTACGALGNANLDSKRALQLDYSPLYQQSIAPSQQRVLLTLRQLGGQTTARILSQDAPTSVLAANPSQARSDPHGWIATLVDYIREGVWHIWIGTDHVLFLLALLLPAVVWRRGWRFDAGWHSMPSLKDALRATVILVTSFTIAHSITLVLSVLGILRLPIQWVETLIAASVLFAALNNVIPIVRRHLWQLAFGFGLLHGAGFASVLTELGLPTGLRTLALLGFNIGVEIGQLVIVLLWLPLGFVLRRRAWYRWGVVVAGSCAVAVISLLWVIERASG